MLSENLASVVLVCGVLAAILIFAVKRWNSFKADAIASVTAEKISKQLDSLIRKEVRYEPVRASNYPRPTRQERGVSTALNELAGL